MTPLRLTDAAGVRWLVADELHTPLSTDPTANAVVPAGSDPRAAHRLFARRAADGAWDVWGCSLARETVTDLSRATLLRQLRESVGPRPRPDELGPNLPRYLERLRALGAS